MGQVYQTRREKNAEHRPTDRVRFPWYIQGDLKERRKVMYIEFPYILFYDPQAAAPGAFCEHCGSECYAPGLHCIRCERRHYDIAGTEQDL